MGKSETKPKALNPKQQRFCEEYLVDLNATAAAKRSGYSEDTAGSIGSENLSKPEIRDCIADLAQARNERTKITADYVLSSIKEVAERCLQRVPVMVQRGKEWVQATDDEGRNVWKFDSSGANKALELLAKNQKLLTDKLEISGSFQLSERLAKARKRRAG